MNTRIYRYAVLVAPLVLLLALLAAVFVTTDPEDLRAARVASSAGLCLEPQNFPDAPNHPDFPKSRLEPGEVYANRVLYKFGAE